MAGLRPGVDKGLSVYHSFAAWQVRAAMQWVCSQKTALALHPAAGDVL